MTRFIDLFRLKTPTLPGRIEILDFIRGMAMLSVLLHHAEVPFGNWILAFHMPFLFLLSGYMAYLRPKSTGFGPYLKNRLLRLVVPYFLFEALNLGLWQLYQVRSGTWQDVSEALKGIVLCINTEGYMGFYGRLWFLPCMFVSDMLFFFLRKCGSKNRICLWASVFILLALSWTTCRFLPFRLPFTMDSALFATACLLAGFGLGRQIQWMLEQKKFLRDLLLLLVSLFLLGKCINSGKAYCLMFSHQYGQFLPTVTAVISGSLAFLILTKWLYTLLLRGGRGKQLVLWYSHNSLATFPIHLLIKMHMPYGSPWYLVFLSMLLLNIPLVNLITLYFPFMLGKFPVRKQPQKP